MSALALSSAHPAARSPLGGAVHQMLRLQRAARVHAQRGALWLGDVLPLNPVQRAGRVVAFVVGKVLSAAALGATCRQHIARFRRPKRDHFGDSLPRNHYGKVLKITFRELLNQGEKSC